MFGSQEVVDGHAQAFRFWAERLRDPALARVVGDWFPAGRAKRADRARNAPPLPADARTDRPLAILRPNWTPHGDYVAIDQRARSDAAFLELAGLGEVWLGPTWRGASAAAIDPATTLPRAKPVLWQTGPQADVAEWSFVWQGLRITRMAVLLRGRQLALLAEQVDGAGQTSHQLRLSLPEGVATKDVAGSRALRLSAGRHRHAYVLPIGLPALPYATDRGALQVDAEARELVLRQRAEGRRTWLPLVVSWNPERNKRPARWRALTVSKRWRISTSDVAQAFRLAWGSGESLVVYRSLAKPDRRAFLGHITEARFLIGLFNSKGVVEPIVEIKDE